MVRHILAEAVRATRIVAVTGILRCDDVRPARQSRNRQADRLTIGNPVRADDGPKTIVGGQEDYTPTEVVALFTVTATGFVTLW